MPKIILCRGIPGSGKTFTIAKKAIDIIEDWDSHGGLALLSFTNIAVDEMKETFKDNCSDANSKYSFIKINVLTNEIIEEFKSMREVYKKHPDASLSSIYAVCSGKNKTSLGFKWKRRLKTTGVIEEPVIKPNKNADKPIQIDFNLFSFIFCIIFFTPYHSLPYT